MTPVRAGSCRQRVSDLFPLPFFACPPYQPVVRRGVTSPKGDGCIFRYFCGEEAELSGVQRLLFGDCDGGLSSGSKSIVLFRVAPQAMAPGCGVGWDRE